MINWCRLQVISLVNQKVAVVILFILLKILINLPICYLIKVEERLIQKDISENGWKRKTYHSNKNTDLSCSHLIS